MPEDVIHRLPITEFRRKFDTALKLILFEKTGEVDLLDEDVLGDKYDQEYDHLKEIGYFNAN